MARWKVLVAATVFGLVVLSVAARRWTTLDTVTLPTPMWPSAEVKEPVGPSEYVVEYAVPISLDQALHEADAVALVRLDTEQAEEIKCGPGSYCTALHFTVLRDVLHPAGPLGGVTVLRTGKRDDVERGFPRPNWGETFLFFLKSQPPHIGFNPIGGPYFTFQVRNGTVHALRASALSVPLDGKGVAECLALLREHLKVT